jgi:hypothetical protein
MNNQDVPVYTRQDLVISGTDTYRLSQEISKFFDKDLPSPADSRWAVWEIISRSPGFALEERLTALRGIFSSIYEKSLKVGPYKDFLQTRYWKTIRMYVMASRGNKCQLCNSTNNLNVHHSTYANHGREHDHLEDLILLCRPCHAKFHDKLPKHPDNSVDVVL